MSRPGTAAVIAIALLAIACGGAHEARTTLSVVTSTTIVEDLVNQVGGDRAEVTSIVPFRADVHTYRVSPSDIDKTSEADLLVIVGGGLSVIEEFLTNGAEGAVLELTHDMDLGPFPEALAHADEDAPGGHEDQDGRHGHAHGAFDPHFWMDIDLAVEAVEAIRDELSRLDPDGTDYYRERTRAYVAELRQVDAEIREQIAGLPVERRYLVTFHDAFGYFATRYGLTILGFVVESPEEEPSASAIAELVESITALGIPFIFSEPQFSARAIERIASDTGATVRTIPSGALAEEYPTYVEFLRAIARGIAD
jgi:ABC-type Zn uptake system ZnuABC Zn-binding protein ZnuA